MLRGFKLCGVASALLVLGLAAGCGSDHSSIRVVHVSPDSGNVDVAVEGKTIVTDLAFQGISPASGYLTVTSGTRRVEVRPNATTTDLVNSTVGFATGSQYTLLVQGKSSNDSVAALVKTDDNSTPPSGSARLRIIHDAPDATNVGTLATCDAPPCVDVYIVAPGTDITSLAPTIPSLAYQQASIYQNLPAGTYEIIMTDSTDTAKARQVDKTYTVSNGQVRTLVTLDTAAGDAMASEPLILSDLN